MSNLHKRITELSPQQKALLIERLSRRAESQSGVRITRQPRERSAAFPLSLAQERLWFIDQIEPGSSAYNMSSIVSMTGALDVDKLERALQEIVRRHETLRVTFAEVDDKPRQLIAPNLALPVSLVDLQHLVEAEREAEAQRLAATDARQPFDLRRGPLLRCTLLRLAADKHLLLLTMHHIISDGWSMGVLLNELTAMYAAFSENRPSPVRELPVQYVDFAVWQRERLQGKILETELAFWKKQLADAPRHLEIPTDYPRPAEQSFRGAIELLTLSSVEVAALKELSRNEDVTLFMTLLACLNLLLHQVTGSTDIVVGSSVANRNHLDTENLIGLFVNQLVLRTNMSGDPTFRELLKRIRQVTLSAYDHQDLPFQWLARALQPERSLSRNPLFQVTFAFQNLPPLVSESAGINWSLMGNDNETAQFDINLLVSESEHELCMAMQYSTDLFKAATIKRMLRLLEVIARRIVENPDARLSSLNAELTAASEQLLRDERQERKAQNTGKIKSLRRRRSDQLAAH